jgi:colanic acid/amylovoran biosynthesis protein
MKDKNIKIVILNYGNRYNKGAAALLNSRIMTLKSKLPDSDFSVFTFHPEIDVGVKYVKTYPAIGNIRSKIDIFRLFYNISSCCLWHYLNKMFNTDIKYLRKAYGLSIYYDADVIISTGGDVITEDYGTLSFLGYFSNFLFALFLDKPVILYAETIGPFKHFLNRYLAKYLLNKIKLISVRENISLQYLQQLHIKTPVILTADSAFLLQPASPSRTELILNIENISKNKLLIGFSVSKLISNYGFFDLHTKKQKYSKYIDIIANSVKYVIKRFDATVVFIPHVIEPWGNDDRKVAADIIQLIGANQNIISIENEYTPEETKSIIGQCNLFIGSRMHATIASTSMLVPTIAIAYGVKTHGIIGSMLGYEKFVLNISDLSYESLISAIDIISENRIQIISELEKKILSVKKSSELNAELVKMFLENRLYKPDENINILE